MPLKMTPFSQQQNKICDNIKPDVDIAKDIDKIHEYFGLLNMIVGDENVKDPGLDGLLTKVLERHEGDFF